MKILAAAALALSVLGLTPATAQMSRETTVRERPNGTIVRRTVVRRDDRRRGYGRGYGRGGYYAGGRRRTVCDVRFRHGQRVRVCRTVGR